MKEIIGNRIRKLRLNKDYSQQNMAGELGISTSAYSKIERGVTDQSVERLKAIGDILGVDAGYFFHEPPPLLTKAEEQNRDIGYASKSDLEDLTVIIKKIQRDIAGLKANLQPPAKPKKKKA